MLDLSAEPPAPAAAPPAAAAPSPAAALPAAAPPAAAAPLAAAPATLAPAGHVVRIAVAPQVAKTSALRRIKSDGHYLLAASGADAGEAADEREASPLEDETSVFLR